MTRKKVLVVDDSSTVVLMEKMILSQGAYDIIVARNGEEAVEAARDQRPDLILMDVMMPKLGGFDACRRLRETDDTRDIPIIMVTTKGEALSMERGYESGCSDYVTKPINATELLAKLQNVLSAVTPAAS